mgnify:CR=1 FL=1
MEYRNFQLDKEWNVVHYPAQPTGFGILIIGDERNFVEKDHSFWTQNEGKLALLNHLKEIGYTVFYSNLYGENWGSDQAAKLAKQLYENMIRNEILNGKIHLLAEGMGALVAMKLVAEMPDKLRSIVLINPILSLENKLNYEKDQKFFYKKFIREFALAYDLSWKEVENHIQHHAAKIKFTQDIPIKIIRILTRNHSYRETSYLSEWSAQLKQEGKTISISYVLPEKMQQLNQSLVSFIKSYEHTL